MSVDLWLTRVKEISLIETPVKESSSLLGELFSVDIQNPQVSSLQNDILDNGININQKVDAVDIYDGDWPGFVELTKSYLLFCRDVDPSNMVESFYSYGQFLSDLQTAFSNVRGAILEETVYITTKVVVPQALSLDSQDSQFEMIRTSFLASVLLKIFNSIRGEKSVGEPLTKKTVIIFVATVLCRLYFKLDQPANCASVFSNIHTANIRFSLYSLAQRVEYRYWLGRFYLNKNQLSHSYNHLLWSFKNCHSSSPNKRLILLYLLAPAILLGKIPRYELLQAYNLDSIYWPLIHSIKRANYQQFMTHLESNEAFFYDHRILVLLQSRSVIILYRMILWRLVITSRQLANNDEKAASLVSFPNLQIAVRLSMGSFFPQSAVTDDYQFIESIAVSLISQGFVKANIYPRMKLIRLKPINALPPVHDVHNANELNLTGRERWMET
ncbi:Thp1p [Sugiyamaella lignohabitans]|uniref:Thp1p n=1 Tax=Sugiyamaella lignohabitans TaxID=796027 RepID=A0A167EWK8_9ASCO|nr:Thp1p [Sugiyamaella lignohabitans]ANB14544.1 Thp1p [Sugiyamaella lignohabitans]